MAEAAIFLAGGYTAMAILAFTMIAGTARPQSLGAWAMVSAAAIFWPVTMLLIRAI